MNYLKILINTVRMLSNYNYLSFKLAFKIQKTAYKIDKEYGPLNIKRKVSYLDLRRSLYTCEMARKIMKVRKLKSKLMFWRSVK